MPTLTIHVRRGASAFEGPRSFAAIEALPLKQPPVQIALPNRPARAIRPAGDRPLSSGAIGRNAVVVSAS